MAKKDYTDLVKRLLDDELLTINTVKEAAEIIDLQAEAIAKLEDALATWMTVTQQLCEIAAEKITLADLSAAGLTIDLKPEDD